MNITLDGMSIQDNYAKSWDGMFTRVSPRLDAVEEISMGSAAGSASDASQGTVQVRFVTRSGTNQWKGSAYYYYRDDVLNSNTWFNTHRNVDVDRRADDEAGGPPGPAGLPDRRADHQGQGVLLRQLRVGQLARHARH